MLKTKMIILTDFSLTPKETVACLDEHIIGQDNAKRSTAIALRNRWRRKQVDGDIKNEIYPHNILMVGPTGVGKTEIARRLAKLIKAPFIKVEATKFTEIGFVGRDVESIIRDLLDLAISMVRNNLRENVVDQAKAAADDRVLVALIGESASFETRAKFEIMLEKGELDEKEVEIAVIDNQGSSMPLFDVPGMHGGQMGILNLGEMFGKALGGPKMKTVKIKVSDARKITLREESDNLIDDEYVIQTAINRVENDGIVFIDEIDKICSRGDSGGRGEVSREGVQRDLLPLIEGTTVSTKYGSVKTDHILFITSGAFHVAKPSDLLPELQGRLPIRVELQALSEGDLFRILKEPKHSLLKQYIELFKVESVHLSFTDEGIQEIARLAFEINREVENIGARRLRTILEKLLERLNFSASETPGAKVVVDKEYVATHLHDLSKNINLNNFIL
jgi:ATP-dependent HslUV protease ATP-binding subunit HslU